MKAVKLGFLVALSAIFSTPLIAQVDLTCVRETPEATGRLRWSGQYLK
jgi:hypothetical protein